MKWARDRLGILGRSMERNCVCGRGGGCGIDMIHR